ncbi:MAG: NAD(P)-binding protein [Actinomycetota bacterium]|nr:NAD(P)-binding protein [Actinomycetota bacterium]
MCHRLSVAVLGAGPIGLEAALAAAQGDLDFTVFEAADAVGGHVRQWSHVRTFTPWSMTVSPRARAVLPEAPDGDELPTGGDLVERLLEPLAATAALAGHLRMGTRVLGVAREGMLKHEHIGNRGVGGRPFRLLVRRDDGSEAIERADVVIDATGTYSTPNRLGDGGIDAINERALDHRIDRYLPDFAREADGWAGRTVLLSGSGHSAQTAARALAALATRAPGTRVVWAVRNPQPDWGAVAGDPLPERASLNASAAELAGGVTGAVEVLPGRVTEALAERDGRVVVTLRDAEGWRAGPRPTASPSVPAGEPGPQTFSREEVEVDRILALNGGVGDHSLYRQLQVHECYATAGPMKLAATLLGETGADCLATGSAGAEALVNPEPGFFILGAKSYGRNSQFLLRTGWQQVDDVFGSLLPYMAGVSTAQRPGPLSRRWRGTLDRR